MGTASLWAAADRQPTRYSVQPDHNPEWWFWKWVGLVFLLVLLEMNGLWARPYYDDYGNYLVIPFIISILIMWGLYFHRVSPYAVVLRPFRACFFSVRLQNLSCLCDPSFLGMTT